MAAEETLYVNIPHSWRQTLACLYEQDEDVRRTGIQEALNTYKYKKDRDTIKYMNYFCLSTVTFFIFTRVINFSARCFQFPLLLKFLFFNSRERRRAPAREAAARWRLPRVAQPPSVCLSVRLSFLPSLCLQSNPPPH